MPFHLISNMLCTQMCCHSNKHRNGISKRNGKKQKINRKYKMRPVQTLGLLLQLKQYRNWYTLCNQYINQIAKVAQELVKRSNKIKWYAHPDIRTEKKPLILLYNVHVKVMPLHAKMTKQTNKHRSTHTHTGAVSRSSTYLVFASWKIIRFNVSCVQCNACCVLNYTTQHNDGESSGEFAW